MLLAATKIDDKVGDYTVEYLVPRWSNLFATVAMVHVETENMPSLQQFRTFSISLSCNSVTHSMHCEYYEWASRTALRDGKARLAVGSGSG